MSQPAQHASYSSISSWSQCGLKYKLTKIDGYLEQPAWWSVGGSAVHKATEWWDIGAHQELSTEDLFVAAFSDEVKQQEKFTLTKCDTWRSSRNQDEAWWMANGPGMVQTYIDWREQTRWQILDIPGSDGQPDLIGVELPVDVELGGMPLKGYIDRVFATAAGEVVILDIKTGARKPDSALQLGFYRAGLELQYGITADLGGYFMNRKKAGEQLIVEGLQQYTTAYVSRFVAGFKSARESGVFLPHVTSFCKSCGVAAQCWAVNPEVEVDGVSLVTQDSDMRHSHM